MSEPVTLYRYPECRHEDGPMEHWCVDMKPSPVVFVERAWCAIHDEPIYMQFGGSVHETDDDCEVWPRLVQEPPQ